MFLGSNLSLCPLFGVSQRFNRKQPQGEPGVVAFLSAAITYQGANLHSAPVSLCPVEPLPVLPGDIPDGA